MLEHAVGLSRPLLLAIAMLTILIGCASSTRSIVQEPLEFPVAKLVEQDGVWAVLVELPNPGWRIVETETEQGRRVFVTIARADPAGIYTQQIVPTTVPTAISADHPADLFARVVAHDWDPSEAVPFHPTP